MTDKQTPTTEPKAWKDAAKVARLIVDAVEKTIAADLDVDACQSDIEELLSEKVCAAVAEAVAAEREACLLRAIQERDAWKNERQYQQASDSDDVLHQERHDAAVDALDSVIAAIRARSAAKGEGS